MTCPSCGSDNPDIARFCGACGAVLRVQMAPEAGGERRQLTVLFCDLVASTALSERLDPEAYREVVRGYHAVSAAEVERFEGHIAQYLGDGLLAYFGYPHAHEEDAARAVHAGLAIIRVIGDLNLRLERERDLRLAVRVGIHTGPVVTDAAGIDEHRDHLAWGPTPNIAAKLQELAVPDTVLLSGATHQLVQGFFESIPVGRRELKGIAVPVETYRVLQATSVRRRFDVAIARGLTPAVDRHQEVATLLEAFDRVRAGRGEVVRVIGDPGIGKSRLLQIFQERAIAGAPYWLLCHCSSYYSTSPLFPVIDLLQRLLGFEAAESPARRLDKLVQTVVPYVGKQVDAVPLLASLLSLPLPADARPVGLTPERQKERTFEVLIDIIVNMAKERPVVVGIEDLHWADPSTLEFLRLLLGKGPLARILLLLTHRPVPSLDVTFGAQGMRIDLDPLADEDVYNMIGNIAGDRGLPADIQRYIADRTDGVPIFIEEMTRAVLESGWPGEDVDRLDSKSLSIPVTLQDLLLARLDRLGPAKDLAQIAAVLGREFAYLVLRAVTSVPDTALRHALGLLVQGGVLSQHGEPPTARYTFKHALIQEAAYRLLLTGKRQQHHARVAEALVGGFPEIIEARPELVAHHYTEAGMLAPAVGYWLAAARRDIERSANVEATRHARQALILLDRLPPTTERDALEVALQTTLGSATIALQGYGSSEVERAFGRAQELCARLGNAEQMFKAQLGLWTYHVVRADYVRALDLAERLLRLAQAPAAPPALIHAHYCIGFTRYYAGEFGVSHDVLCSGAAIACEDADPALMLPTGDDVRIHLLCFLALSLWHLGRPDEAAGRGAEAIALARRRGHPYGLSFALVLGGFVGMLLRDIASTKNLVEEGLSLALEKGYRYMTLMGGFLRGWVAVEEGAADEGLAMMRRAIDGIRVSGAQMGQTLLMIELAASYLRLQRPEEARQWLDEVEAAMQATGERNFEAELHRLRAESMIVFEGHRSGTAEEAFLRSLDVAQRQQNRGHQLRVAQGLAAHLLARGEGRRARTMLGSALAEFPKGADTADLRKARALFERLG
jgi:class 3 adenylate cyclase